MHRLIGKMDDGAKANEMCKSKKRKAQANMCIKSSSKFMEEKYMKDTTLYPRKSLTRSEACVPLKWKRL